MMIIKKLLLCGFASLVSAELYLKDENAINPLKLSTNTEDISMEALNEALKVSGSNANQIQFDKANSSKEVARLPISFFTNLMNTEQLIQIVLNPKLKKLLLVKSAKSSKVKDRKLLLNKITAITERLITLTPTVLGPRADAVMSRLPTQTYSKISPLLALVARGFRATIKGLARVFNITLRALKVIGPYIIPIVLTALKVMLQAFGAGNIVFTVMKAVLALIKEFPVLEKILGPRVTSLVGELNEMTDHVNDKALDTKQSVKSYSKSLKNANLTSKSDNEPVQEMARDNKKNENIFDSDIDQSISSSSSSSVDNKNVKWGTGIKKVEEKIVIASDNKNNSPSLKREHGWSSGVSKTPKKLSKCSKKSKSCKKISNKKPKISNNNNNNWGTGN